MAVCLIVARDGDARERVARCLDPGFDVVHGVTASEGLTALARERPDLVVVSADDPDEGPGTAGPPPPSSPAASSTCCSA